MWTPLRLRGRAPYLAKRLLLGAIIAGGFPQPALSLDFTKGTLDPRITASGGAGGTRMSASGNIVSASCPRFDHENPRTNLVTQSDGNASTYSSTAGTTNAAAPISLPPVGFTNSIQFPAAGICTAYKISTQVVGGTYTFTFFVQMDDGSVPVISSSDTPSVDFSVQANNTPLAADSITAVGVGVYRVSKTFVAISHNTVGVVRYAAQSGKRFKVTGFQLEVGNVATPYIPTGATAVTVASPKGVLVEEQRTNLFTNSSDFTTWAAGTAGDAIVIANAINSPSGAGDGSLLNDNSNVGVISKLKNVVIVSGTTAYTESLFVKAGTAACMSIRAQLSGGVLVVAEVVVNPATGAAQWRNSAAGASFSIVSAGNGWWRIAFTIIDNASGNNLFTTEIRPCFAATYTGILDQTAQGTTYAWGAQLEAGTFATSYIPTTTAAVTRTADSLLMTGTNFSSWYNASEGTIVISAQRYTANQLKSGLYHFDGGVGNRIISVSNSAGTGEQYLMDVGGVNQVIAVGAPPATVKSAFSYKENNSAVLQKGVAIHTDAVCTVPAVTFLRLAQFNAVDFLNGHLKQFKYYGRRASNATMFRLLESL